MNLLLWIDLNLSGIVHENARGPGAAVAVQGIYRRARRINIDATRGRIDRSNTVIDAAGIGIRAGPGKRC